VFTLRSVATSCCRPEYLVWERQGWSSSILEWKLTAHTTAISSSRRVCCLMACTACRSPLQVDMHQDGAPPHTARTTIDYLNINKEHTNFIEPNMWPPNSPDINPVDYALFGYSFTIDNSIRWNNWSERQSPSGKNSRRFIDNSINKWRRRLEAVIKNGGGHIEQIGLSSRTSF